MTRGKKKGGGKLFLFEKALSENDEADLGQASKERVEVRNIIHLLYYHISVSVSSNLVTEREKERERESG